MKTTPRLILIAFAGVAFAEPALPAGMVLIPRGIFAMGSELPGSRRDEGPVVQVTLDSFWMDECDVTNAEFRKFVEATGYKTIAERPIDWEEIKKTVPPGTPKPPDEHPRAGVPRVGGMAANSGLKEGTPLAFFAHARSKCMPRSSVRCGSPTDTGMSNIGFRCAKSVLQEGSKAPAPKDQPRDKAKQSKTANQPTMIPARQPLPAAVAVFPSERQKPTAMRANGSHLGNYRECCPES